MNSNLLSYPNYNLIRYEYSLYDSACSMVRYYINILYKYYPDNIEDIYDWFALLGEIKLKYIGLQIISTDSKGKKLVTNQQLYRICLIHRFQIPSPLITQRYLCTLTPIDPMRWSQ